MCKQSLYSDSSSSASRSTTVDKTIPGSGFERHRRLVEIGLVVLAVTYGGLYYLDPPVNVNPELCSSQAIVANGGYCRRPDLIAYKAVSLLAMIAMGSIGIYNWHFTSTMKQLGSMDATAEDRLFGHLPASNVLNVIIFCYQLWDFCVSLTVPEQLDVIFLVHHLLALLTAFCALEYQMMSYYSIFYGGCSEFSTIFLIFLDKQGVIPIQPNSLQANWVQMCQVVFFFTFSYYRIYGWIGNSFPLWRDCQEVIRSGSVEKYRPGKAGFLRLFQGLDFTLGALQCFWYYKILVMIAGMI
jgi:hypothetical protein